MSIIGGISFGGLTDYLFFFENGSARADWHDAKHGYLGNCAVNGVSANMQTNSNVPYAGSIYTNSSTLGDWQDIVDTNPGQAFALFNEANLIDGLRTSLVGAFHQINGLNVTPGYDNRSAESLDGLDTTNGINEVFVINITSGFDVNTKINITGDPGDVYILRWDEDKDPSNGYQGRVRFHQGGAIVPHGGLIATNFINVAGEIDSAGGGSTPVAPYPQGPRYNNGTGPLITGGSDWSAGGYYTGYWLTTGEPTNYDPVKGLWYGDTPSLSDATFVGGWYTITSRFVLTAQSGGVYVNPNSSTLSKADISISKYVSPDSGVTWISAETAPGPNISSNVQPQFKFVITNTGNVPLSFVSVTDSVYGVISLGGNLDVGKSFNEVIIKPWTEGQHENIATATGTYGTDTVSSTDMSHYVGVPVEIPALQIVKFVSTDGGLSFVEANTAPGPDILSTVQPIFKFVSTNIGNEQLTGVVVTDDKFGLVSQFDILQVGESEFDLYTATWEEGQHVNTATATSDQGVTDQSTAYYNGVLAAPGINLVKLVSPDNGNTWLEVGTPPGPSIPSNISPQFKFLIINTGNVDLVNVSVSDTVYGNIGSIAVLPAGNKAELGIIVPWEEGAHENTATVTALFGEETLTASDVSYYLGDASVLPGISILKYVSVDNGVTWIHSTTPKGPLLPDGVTPMFKYVVTNTGNTPLTNVAVNDDVLGEIASGISLAVGESQTWII